MSEIKLKPCPFCGGEFHIDVCGMIYIPKCKKCGCKLAGCRTQEEAIEEANTRKPMERIIERIKSFPHGYFNVETMEELIEIVKEEGGIE